MTNDRPEFLFVGAREVREVPKGWRHPKDGDGRFIPLLPTDYWSDEDVSPAARMPGATGEVEIAAYEVTTEGTPISPSFPNTPAGKLALVNWCAANATTFGAHRADSEAWAAILFGDAAVALDGAVRA